MGGISYITKALSAVLQLAVTMDYSIFLWHAYNEQRDKYADHCEAMTIAFPGLSADLNINKDSFDIPDYVEIITQKLLTYAIKGV